MKGLNEYFPKRSFVFPRSSNHTRKVKYVLLEKKLSDLERAEVEKVKNRDQ